MAKSNDGINWERLGINIIEDKLGDNECQAGPDVFYYKNINSQGNIYSLRSPIIIFTIQMQNRYLQVVLDKKPS